MEEKGRFEEAKRLYKDANADQRYVLERLFPQLIESEDERIRKAILNYFIKCWGNSQDDVCGVHVEDIIAWLEKQGNQKPTDIQSIEKRAHEVFPDDDDENTPLYRQAFINGAVDYIDCGCKNIAWSREDEQNLNAALGYIDDEYLRRWLKDAIHNKYEKPTCGEEDERIRKDLISHFEETIENIKSEEIVPHSAKILVSKMQKWVAWLENARTW